jgi:ABC-type amino acid transport substrate-binding protein
MKTGHFVMVFLGPPVSRRQVSIGLRKQDRALTSEIDTILKKMREDGFLQEYIRKVARCEYDCKIAFQRVPLKP